MDISIWGVIVGTVVAMIIGMLWYSPVLFGKKFMTLMGLTPDQMAHPDWKGAATKAYSVGAIFYVIMSFALAYFIERLNATEFTEGAVVGFIAWLGFMVPISITTILYEKRSKGLFYLNIFYHLVTVIIVGGIIAQWFS
jgi:hypothetical protein